MAHGNLILGTMSGKLGDVVAYNYNGKQAARVRRRQIANPKTSKQAIQRAIAATVAKFVSAFAPVLNNSLQSEQTKVKTLAKIRGLNMNMLRQLAAAGNGTYCPKGAMFIVPNDYLISRGTLSGIEPLSSDDARLEMNRTVSGLFNATDIVVNATNTASQAFPGIAVGDQITIIATSHTSLADGSQVAYCRFAFKDDTTPVFLATEDEGEFLLNPAAIDLTKADGKYDELVFETATFDGSAISRIHVGNLLGGVVFLDNFGIIVSREKNKLRSNAHMISIARSGNSLAEVYPTYMDGGTAIDMPSDNYLDNDVPVQSDSGSSLYKGYATGSNPALPFTFTQEQQTIRINTSAKDVPFGTQTLGTIKGRLNDVVYETTIDVTNIGSSVIATATLEENVVLGFEGLNAQGYYLDITPTSVDANGFVLESIYLNW